MKKLYTAILATLGMFIILSASAEAQTIQVGGGVGYGTKSEDPNVSVGVYYRLPTLPLRLGTDVKFAKPESDLTQIDGNFNVHFMAVDTDLLSIYSITGLNVAHSRFSAGGQSITDTDTGFNIGAGGELDLGFGRGFGEAVYVLGSDREEQWQLGVGVRISMTNR